MKMGVGLGVIADTDTSPERARVHRAMANAFVALGNIPIDSPNVKDSKATFIAAMVA